MHDIGQKFADADSFAGEEREDSDGEGVERGGGVVGAREWRILGLSVRMMLR